MVGQGSGTSVDEVVIEPSKQTISEAKIKEIHVPDNTAEFYGHDYTGYSFFHGFLPSMLLYISKLGTK